MGWKEEKEMEESEARSGRHRTILDISDWTYGEVETHGGDVGQTIKRRKDSVFLLSDYKKR